MAQPYIVFAFIALLIFVLGILILPVAIYFSRRAAQINQHRINKAMQEQHPVPPMPLTYEQRKIDRAARLAKELEDFDDRLKGR